MTPYELIMTYSVFMNETEDDVDPKDLIGAIALASMDEEWSNDHSQMSSVRQMSLVFKMLRHYEPIHREVMKEAVLKEAWLENHDKVINLLVEIWDEPNVFFRDIKFKNWLETSKSQKEST